MDNQPEDLFENPTSTPEPIPAGVTGTFGAEQGQNIEQVTLETASTTQLVPKKKDNWLMFGLKLVGLAVAVFLFTQLVIPPYIVRGMSMETNFHDGERLITDRAVFKLFGHPQRDDVVILNEPPNNSQVLIKRVIGLPGDTVQVKNETVFINGKALDEPFIQHKPDYQYGPEVVPVGQYFVMGDNRSNSLDSHYFGFVPADNIIARVWFSLP